MSNTVEMGNFEKNREEVKNGKKLTENTSGDVEPRTVETSGGGTPPSEVPRTRGTPPSEVPRTRETPPPENQRTRETPPSTDQNQDNCDHNISKLSDNDKQIHLELKKDVKKLTSDSGLIKKLTGQLENVDRINKNLTDINKKLKDAKTEDEKKLLSIDKAKTTGELQEAKSTASETKGKLKQEKGLIQDKFKKIHKKLSQNGSHGTADSLAEEVGEAVNKANKASSKKRSKLLQKMGVGSGGGLFHNIMKKLHIISMVALIGVILFTITFFTISESAWDEKKLGKKKFDSNNKQKSVKKQIDLGLYWGMGTLLVWILMVSIHLGE